MGVDPIHEQPHASDDPRYCETWAFSFADARSGSAALIHSSWLPAQGVGNHLVSVVTPDRTEDHRVETREPLRSELFCLELEPWRSAIVRAPSLDIELRFDAFTEAVDFGDLFSLGDDMQQAHAQAGVRCRGHIGTQQISGPGFRDRSWGPRDLRHIGRMTALALSGEEQDCFVTVNALTSHDRPISASPDTTLGCSVIDGRASVWSDPIRVLRRADATPAAFELPVPTEPRPLRIELDLSRSFAFQRFLADRGSAPGGFPTPEPVLAIRTWSLDTVSPRLGRLAGWYQEGMLLTN